jgi:hypothetical protein
MQHARRTILSVVALTTGMTAAACTDGGTVGPPTPAASSPRPGPYLADAAADSALTVQAKLRATHGDSALLRYLVATGYLWRPERARQRDANDPSRVASLRDQLDKIGPLRNLTSNGTTYDWDGTVPAEDASPAKILMLARDAGSPTPFVPGYASATVIYHGDIARNTLAWTAKSTYATTLAAGKVEQEGTGAYLCDEPGTANGESYPYEWGGLVCRYHRFTTYVPIHINNPSECGVTVEASGSAHAWKGLPFGLGNVTLRGGPISLSINNRWGSSGEAGAPSKTSDPLPCEFEEAARDRSGSGPQTTTASGWPAVLVSWWEPPRYHPEIPLADGPNVGIWCQVTLWYSYGRLFDATAQCFGRESGM